MGACALLLLWCLGVWAGWQGVVGSHGGRRLLTAGCFVWRRFGGFYLRGGVGRKLPYRFPSRRHELTRLVGELWGRGAWGQFRRFAHRMDHLVWLQ